MIICLKESTTEKERNDLITFIESKDVKVKFIEDKNVLLCIGDNSFCKELIEYKFIGSVYPNDQTIFYASREFFKDDVVVDINGLKIGGKEKVVFIGGPCSIESEDITYDIARGVKLSGGHIFRGGAYKPRTSPYSFQGLQGNGIQILNNVRNKLNIPVISEIMSTDKVDEFVKNVDIIQVGARNMQNFPLLKELGKTKKPIVLKRGISSTIEEWLMAAEYILAEGNPNVILCERGIRTYGNETRNTLDLSSIPYIKQCSPLPIIVDPSHATGKRELISSMALAAIAAGADGIMIEVHLDPDKAWSDKDQCVSVEEFDNIVNKCKKIAKAIDRKCD